MCRKKGAPYCRTRSAQGPTVRQYHIASPPSNVSKIQQPATSTAAREPTNSRDENPVHATNSCGSKDSLLGLQSSSDFDNVSKYGNENAESPPRTLPHRESKAEPNDHPILSSLYLQDLQIDYERHNSYGIQTQTDAQQMVPPVRKPRKQEARTIPYVINEGEYLIQKGLITRCHGERNSFYWLGT